MLKRLSAWVLISSLVPTAGFAQSLTKAVATEAAKLAQAQAPPKPNPYKTQSWVLIGGGAALLVLGLAQDRGAEVSVNPFGTTASVKETGGSKTALTVLGLATMAGGGFLYWRGEQKRKNPSIMPFVRVKPEGLLIGSAVRF